MKKLYTFSGALALISSVSGSLLLSISPDNLIIVYLLWGVGVVSFAFHFAIVKAFTPMVLNAVYHAINSYGIMRLIDFNSFAIYLGTGGILMALAFYCYSNKKICYTPKNAILESKAAKYFEYLAVTTGLTASLLLAFHFKVIYAFDVWMVCSLSFIGMSLLLRTYYVMYTQFVYLITQSIGIYNNTTSYLFTVTLIICFFILFSLYLKYTSLGSKMRALL